MSRGTSPDVSELFGRIREEARRVCSRCGERDRMPRQRYCRECASAYMRQWRAEQGGYAGEVVRIGPRAVLTPQDRRLRANARAAVKVRLVRGTMTRGPCEVCATTVDVEAHHDDYSRPFDVRWLCRAHHRAHHRAERAVPAG